MSRHLSMIIETWADATKCLADFAVTLSSLSSSTPHNPSLSSDSQHPQAQGGGGERGRTPEGDVAAARKAALRVGGGGVME